MRRTPVGIRGQGGHDASPGRRVALGVLGHRDRRRAGAAARHRTVAAVTWLIVRSRPVGPRLARPIVGMTAVVAPGSRALGARARGAERGRTERSRADRRAPALGHRERRRRSGDQEHREQDGNQAGHDHTVYPARPGGSPGLRPKALGTLLGQPGVATEGVGVGERVSWRGVARAAPMSAAPPTAPEAPTGLISRAHRQHAQRSCVKSRPYRVIARRARTRERV